MKAKTLFFAFLFMLTNYFAYCDCCDCGPIYKDNFFKLPFCINNKTNIKLSKSIFNIPELLAESDYFYIDETVKLEKKLLETDGSYYMSYFNFNSSLLWHKKDSVCTPLWVGEYGDFWHKPILIDLNKDKKTDIFVRYGHEAVSKTYIYINMIEKMEFSDSNFIMAYHKDDEYLNIIDADNDKHPELLETKGKTFSEEMYDGEFEPLQILISDLLHLPDTSIINNLKIEYKKVFNFYDTTKFNLDFNMPDSRYKFLLRPMEEVRILTFEDHEVRDITYKFKEHLKWRINLLEKLKPFATVEGVKELESLKEKYRILIENH